MNIWRMKLRAGDYGDDMWPLCKRRGIASMTHPPIYETDLTDLEKNDVDPDVKTAARSSIWRFAWDMKGGDVIFVGDSVSKSIIAKGYITSESGQRAYRYNNENAMKEPSNAAISWRHEVPVSWDEDFVPFRYIDGGPRITVMHFDPTWAKEGSENTLESNDTQDIERLGGNPPNDDESFINESAYMRDTPASQKNVLRLHAALSNRFKAWLNNTHQIQAIQERKRIDLQFVHLDVAHLAELKICYGENTKHAIREGLGQILEYNHYPEQEAKGSWWLVLDCKPSTSDMQFVSTLIDAYHLPLTLAWSVEDGFELFPNSPF